MLQSNFFHFDSHQYGFPFSPEVIYFFIDEKVAKVRKAWETEAAIRNAESFYCSWWSWRGPRVNSSVTADRLLYFLSFHLSVWSRCLSNFVTVLMSALLRKALPFDMKTLTVHHSLEVALFM